MSTPVLPAMGSTITAAMLLASCSATSFSRSSANSAPCAGWPGLKALRARSCVWRMWSVPATARPKVLRLPIIPPTEMPPKLTPW
jgi:hypothetical protein